MKEIKQSLAPYGTLRAAINLGNNVLAEQGDENAPPSGISVEFVRQIGSDFDLPVEYVIFNSAREVVESAGQDVWDIAFLARDPKRAEAIWFSEPYLLIEGSYLVREESDFESNADVDQPGTRIAVGKGAAYDLYLSRTLEFATLLRASTTPGAVDLFIEQQLEAAAGVRQPLQAFAEQTPGFRVLSESFMTIEQTVALPVRYAALEVGINQIISENLQSGFIQALVDRFDKRQAIVPNAQCN